MITKARASDFAFISLVAFNGSLAIHYLVKDWVISVCLSLFSVIVTIIFVVATEDGKQRLSNNNQIALLNCLICSLFGGLIAWLIII